MNIHWTESFLVRFVLLGVVSVCILTGAVGAWQALPTRAQQDTTLIDDSAQHGEARQAQSSQQAATFSPVDGKAPLFTQLSLEQGLSSNLVQAVLQDRQGFIWFATMEGLNRYDGYEVTVYRPDPGNPNSVSDTVINGLYQDRMGDLWVATTNGLNRFDPATETFTRYVHDPDDPTSIGGDAFSVVDCFYEDEAGQLWFSTWSGGLSRFDRTTETFTNYQHDSDDPDSLLSDVILKMAASVDGSALWLATPQGLNRFDIASTTSTHYRHDPTDPASLSYNEVNSVYASTLDDEPVVWLGTADGKLNQFDPQRETFTHHAIAHTKITEIYEAVDGLLWLGTQGEGVFIFDPDSGSVLAQYQNEPGNPNSLGADLVNHVYRDQSGALWIATYTGGVSRLDPWRKGFQLYRHQPDDPNSLSSSQIYALDLDQEGRLWIGTLDAGFNRFDPERETFTRYLHQPDNPNSLSHNIVTDVLADRQGNIWAATVGGGLNRFDPERETFTHYRHDENDPNSLLGDGILTLFEDSSGMLWLGMSDSGLSRFDPQRETFTHYHADPTRQGSLSDTSVSAVFEDRRGRVWVGNKRGLDTLSPDADSFTNYQHDDGDPNSLSHNYIKAIYEDSEGILWLTTDVGLNRFDPEAEQFRHYFARDGLAHNQVSSIVADEDGNLWLGTSGGLSRFDPETETFRNYNQHDGLQGDIFSPYAAARGPDGTLYFGGSNGLNIFHPDDLNDNPYSPQVVLTEFQLFNEPVIPGSDSPLPRQIGFVDEITLAHDQSIIGFEFVALNYTAPANNQYAYMMEGFDQEWTYTDSSRRFARYTNLDPGRYTFRVKASNNDGVWNETGTAVDIIITPPWWETTWFQGLMLALLAALVLGGFQWRVWSIKQQQRQLEIQVDRRTSELRASEAALRQAKQAAEAANQAKSIFLASMSHELRTPLNTILGYAQILQNRPASVAHLEQGLQSIQRSGDHLLTLINDVLDIAKIEAERIELQPGDFHLPDFLEEIAASSQVRAEQKGLAFDFVTGIFPPSGPPSDTFSRQPPPTDTSGSNALPTIVHGDARRLRQILLNLLTNAVKFTPHGRVTFRVGRVVNVAPPATLVRFQVEDTGPGIAADERERIFEPFQQIRKAPRSTEGVGLGLTISRHLVQLMGGELQVSSTAGQGSIFWFDLPLPEAAAAASIRDEQRRIIGVVGRQPRILVVDDVADNREVLMQQLAPLGFELAEAASVAEGEATAQTFQPEAMIVDLKLPDGSGLDLIRHLRQQPGFADTVILVSSASVFAEDQHQSLHAGANDFLPKPVNMLHLLEMLAQHLHLQWRYAEPPARENEGNPAMPLVPLAAEHIPPHRVLTHLHKLAMMGHAAALQAQAAEMARSEECYAPFAVEVERLARALQMNETCAFLEQYLE